MKKVIVIGCAGGGKSYFSRKLRETIGLPLYHLDNIYWNEDGTTLEKGDFYEKLRELLELDEWIIDGNYKSTMEQRIQACDTVFFLDYPTEVCLMGLQERRGKPRPDMPCVLGDRDGEEFVNSVKSYNEIQRPAVLALLRKYSDKNIIIFKSREECNKYIQNFK